MKKIQKIALFAVCALLFSSSAYAEGKIDPLLNIMASRPNAAVAQMKAFGAKAIGGVAMTEVLIKAEAGQVDAAKAFIEKLGGSVRTIFGEIMTATIPLDSLSDLDDSDLIVAVEAAKPMRSKDEIYNEPLEGSNEDIGVDVGKMNYARTSVGSNADQVQAGTCAGCTGGYTGTNVIVGVVDSGIDCQHADFKNSAGATRIIAYKDQATDTEYTGSALSTGGTCSNSPDTSGHGTHVTGIAAGSNSTYTGVASTADIVAVKYNVTDASSSGSFSTKILEGVDYIFSKATSATKAAVVNLSLGTSLGAHDGTSLLEQGLDAALVSGSSEKAGRAIIDAAGNENMSTSDSGSATYGGIHATISVASGTDKGFEVGVRDSAEAVSAGGTIIDFWLDSGTTCTVRVIGYPSAGGASVFDTGAVAYGAATTTATDNSVTVSLSYSETATSGKKHGTATINRSSSSISSSILESYYFHFVLSGTCTGNAWLYPDYTSVNDFTKVNQVAGSGYTYVAGDSNLTITIPGTASKVITVASYMDVASWVSMDGTTYYQTTYGTCGGTGGTNQSVSLFSSLGPTANASDLQKPDITAPGEPIMSTLSSSVSPSTCYKGDATHYKSAGTSMASPHVAGIAALMFQKNNCLTATNVKTYLRNSATADSYTGSSLPTYAWGYGKVNAAAVMNLFSADTSCQSGGGGGSSSSCSLVRNGSDDVPFASVFVALLGVLVLICGRNVVARFIEHR